MVVSIEEKILKKSYASLYEYTLPIYIAFRRDEFLVPHMTFTTPRFWYVRTYFSFKVPTSVVRE